MSASPAGWVGVPYVCFLKLHAKTFLNLKNLRLKAMSASSGQESAGNSCYSARLYVQRDGSPPFDARQLPKQQKLDLGRLVKICLDQYEGWLLSIAWCFRLDRLDSNLFWSVTCGAHWQIWSFLQWDPTVRPNLHWLNEGPCVWVRQQNRVRPTYRCFGKLGRFSDQGAWQSYRVPVG